MNAYMLAQINTCYRRTHVLRVTMYLRCAHRGASFIKVAGEWAREAAKALKELCAPGTASGPDGGHVV